MIFDKIEGVTEYLIGTFQNSKDKTLAYIRTSSLSTAICIYEGEDIIQGLMLYFDMNRKKWILLDSLPADLSARYYVEYRHEFEDAIALFELLDSMDEDENDEETFFADLDI